jgi:hypothetical protein
MADKLIIYKLALNHLGKDANALSSLTDVHEGRYQFDAVWSAVVQEAFNEGDWNFAKAAVSLTRNVLETATLGYTYVYDYPADWERTISVSSMPDFYSEFYDYTDQGGFLHSNSDPLYLRYVSAAKQADDQVSTWPTMFFRYVAVKLAFEACLKLTGSTSLYEALMDRQKKALRQWKSVDARNEPNKRPLPGSWLRARVSGYGGYGGLCHGGTLVGSGIVAEEGDV